MDLEYAGIVVNTSEWLAMKKKRNRDGNTSGMSYLDTITCGFGAIILLLIVVKPEPVDFLQSPETLNLELEIASARAAVLSLQEQLEAILSSRSNDTGESISADDIARLEDSITTANLTLDNLLDENKGLELAIKSLQSANIQVPTQPEIRDPEVGGIPVDSEYVIFIVDTSGSMQQIWGDVVEAMANILDIHPEVAGFQVLNDNGAYLVSQSKRKWLPDTPGTRQSIKNLLSTWAAFSNSSPVEGLEIALRTYAGKSDRISIYVVGDEFTGASYDIVLDTLAQLNVNQVNGQVKVRVHSIGFPILDDVYVTGRQYATLMRAVVEKNRGAFIGLPNLD